MAPELSGIVHSMMFRTLAGLTVLTGLNGLTALSSGSSGIWFCSVSNAPRESG